MTSNYGYGVKELIDLPIKYGDMNVNNRTSIVFEFEYGDLKFLFTGDTCPADTRSNILADIQPNIWVGILANIKKILKSALMIWQSRRVMVP